MPDNPERWRPSWEDILEAVKSEPSSPSALPGWYKDDQNVTDFGPTPLHDDVRVLACPDCKRPVLQEAFGFHQKNCQLIRDIKSGKVEISVLDPPVRSRKRSNAVFDEDDEEDDEPLVRKPSRGDERPGSSAQKKPRQKGRSAGPLDVDRQCGVMTEKGVPCFRSLTCKTHPMGAKRSVQGRSRPYDELLFEWQKATNPSFLAKLEEKERAAAAASAAKAAAAEEKLERKLKKKKAVAAAAQAAGAAVAAAGGDAAAVAAAVKAAGKDGTGSNLKSAAATSSAEDPEADMYSQGAGDAEVEQELQAIFAALKKATTQPRMSCVPLAYRKQSSAFVSRSNRMMQYRSLIQGALRGHGGSISGDRSATFARP